MGKITAADVNKLRKQTGAGMMDCKKALTEAEGDFEAAVEVLRKKGQKVAANRADRDSSEGVAIAKVTTDGSMGSVISLNCETDFVAKNEDYIKLANDILDLAIDNKAGNRDALLAADFKGLPVQEKLIEQTGVIGEKLELKNYESIEAPAVGSYIHAGNKIAVIVGLSKKVDGFQEVGKKMAMQIAAMNPLAVDESEISDEVKERELRIAKDVLKEEGKPEDMIEKIAPGKMKKFFKENTLLHQAFIEDNKTSVADYLKSIDKELTVTSFKRVSLV